MGEDAFCPLCQQELTEGADLPTSLACRLKDMEKELKSEAETPFDRILVAQEKTETILLLTNDTIVADYGKPVRIDACLGRDPGRIEFECS